MKTSMGFVSAFLIVVAPAALLADGPEPLPTKFDASTGYVTMTVTDTANASRTKYAFRHNAKKGDPQPGVQGATGQWSEDAEKPHGGTNYYVGAKMTLCTDNSQGGAYAFAGDRLVIGSDAVLQSMASGQNVVTISDLYMIGGSKFVWTAQKNALQGTTYVVDSSSKFVYFTVNYTANDIQAFGMKLVGNESQKIFVSGGSNKTNPSPVDGVVRSGHLDLEGDLSDYKGTIYLSDTACVRIGTTMPGGSVAMYTNKRGGYFGTMPNKGDLTVNKVTAIRGMKVMASAGSTLTVNTLSMTADDTLGVTWGAASDTPGKLVVNGFSGTWPSVIKVVAEGTPHGYRGEIIRIKAAALPTGGLTASDFAFPEALGVSFSVAQEEATGDCVISMQGIECVEHTANKTALRYKTPNDFTSCTNYSGKYFWANNSCPAEDEQATEKIWSFSGVEMYTMDALDYQQFGAGSDGIYAIPSKYVHFDNNGGIEHFSTCSGLRADFIWNGFYDNGNAGASAIKVTTPDRTGAHDTFGYYGTIRLMDGSLNSLLMYGSGLELIAAALSGGGDLTLKTMSSASSASSNQGWYELTADNSEWSGKLKVTQDYERAKYQPVVTPNMDICCRVVISRANNLGGARAAYAYDALHLEHYAKLVIREDVTLAGDLNRGVSIGDVGRFWQPAGKTLAINQPITLWGNLLKEGPGTLVLGGASLKFNGATQANVPTANSNLVTVAEGALKVTNAAALDGAAVTFKGGTKLIIPVDTDATTDFARFGAINTKDNGGFTSTATDGRIPVAFELPTEQPLTTTAAICTVKSDSALTKDSFAISRPRGYSVTLGDPVDNGNGTKTFKVTLERKGIILIFR